MKATQLLHTVGRASGSITLPATCLIRDDRAQYITELSVAGLTLNPTLFDHAFQNSCTYDASIRENLKRSRSGETLLFGLAIRRHHARCRSLPPDPRTNEHGRRLGVVGGLAAHADRRTMPNGLGFPRFYGELVVIGSA